ncbi:MAG: hypothetical protein K6G51_02995 [Sphaerochaetaceae bacterium]|nr:hypothetical protein [Sphaerochaetaceae bacterium]
MENGLQVLYEMKNDNHDLPMHKDYIFARLTQIVENYKLIHLPRYMDRMHNNIIGEKFFDNYSLADGISVMSSDGRTFDFKYINSGILNSNIRKASQKADVSVIVVDAKRNSIIRNLENKNLNENKEIVVYKINREKDIKDIYIKKANSEKLALGAKITGSQPDTLESRYPSMG